MPVAALQLQLLLAEAGDCLQLLGLGREEGMLPEDLPLRIFIYVCIYIGIFPPKLFQKGGARLAFAARIEGSGAEGSSRGPSPVPALFARGGGSGSHGAAAGCPPPGPSHPRRAAAGLASGRPELVPRVSAYV